MPRANPYLTLYESVRARYPSRQLPWEEEPAASIVAMPGFHNTTRLRSFREPLTRRYAFGVPGDAALAVIARYSPLVEMGAGSGYWAAVLQRRGADVLAYDSQPPGAGNSWFRLAHAKVARGFPSSLRRVSPQRTLLLVWPSYDSPMAYDCLRNFRGRHAIYVGEGRGGCTANDDFFDELERGWTLVEDFAVPRWETLHDRGYVWRRRDGN